MRSAAMRGLFCRGALLWLALTLLSACSARRPYPAQAENNAVVSAVVSGGLLTRIDADLDIYAVDRSCQLEYLGSVALNETPRTIGLPVGENRYLAVRFARSSFLANSSGQTSYETLFVAKPRQRYTLEASYRDRIYNVVVRDAAGREIDSRDLGSCKPH